MYYIQYFNVADILRGKSGNFPKKKEIEFQSVSTKQKKKENGLTKSRENCKILNGLSSRLYGRVYFYFLSKFFLIGFICIVLEKFKNNLNIEMVVYFD